MRLAHSVVEPTARENISLSCGTHCCPNIFYFLCPTTVAILCTMCVHIHISDCVETVYELPLLPNSTAGETFLHKSGAVRRVDWIFITGAPAWR